MAYARRQVEHRDISFGIQGSESVEKHLGELLKISKQQRKEMEKTLSTMQEGTAEYDNQKRKIALLNKEIDRMSSNSNKLLKVLQDPMGASSKELKQAMIAYRKGIEQFRAEIGKNGLITPESEEMLKNMVHNLQLLEATQKSSMKGFKEMTANLQTEKATYKDLDAYVKIYEENGKELARSYENQNGALVKMGENATKAKVRMAELDGTLVAINKNTSKEGLERTANFFKEIQAYSGASAEQVKDFGNKYNLAMSELAERNKAIVASPQMYSVNEVREATRWLQDYQNNARLSASEQDELNRSIMQGSQYVKDFGEKAKLNIGGAVWMKMASQLSNIKNISREALSEQLKYWQDVQSKAEHSSLEFKAAERNIKSVNEELARRNTLEVQQQGKSIVESVTAGTFKKSISETQEAIKKLEEFRSTLKTAGDDTAIRGVDDAIVRLKDSLEQSKQEVLAGKEAMQQFGEETGRVAALEKQGADGLAKMRANLDAYKRTLKGTDAAKHLRNVESLIADVDKAQRKLNYDTIEWSKFKGEELKKRSISELRTAYEALKRQVETLSPAQQSYNERAMQMRSIKKQTDELTKATGEQVSKLGQMANKVKGIVLAYVGFHAVWSKVQKTIREVSELSDLMTNVQKVAGLTADETARMTDALQRLDTRSTTQQLMEIAEQGAKLGVATQGGADAIVQFVKAGEQITNTLGSDVGAEAISDLLKVNDLLNKNSQGIERDLLNVGSAILNVGNNSKASYANVLEFTRTMGSVGSVVGLTLPQVVALGGTLDSLGANMDSSATGIQRVLMGLNTNTAAVARAVHMSVSELQEMIDEKGVLAALQEALLHIKNEGIVGINNFMKALGSGNSVQTRSAVALLIENLDVLNYQIRLAEKGYADGTIVTHEFNKANDNLAGTMKRVENEFYELFSNQKAANFFTPLAKGLLSFAKLLNSSAAAAAAFGGAIAFVATQFLLALAKIDAIKASLINLKGQLVALGGGFKALGVWLVASVKQLLGVKGAADQAKAAMDRLKAASMTNWITALITVLSTLVVYFANLGKEISNATKATVDMRKAHDDQMATLRSLNDSLLKNIHNEQERVKLIDEFNNKFGGYLTSLLNEKSTVEDIALAYLQAANAIREKNAAQMMNEARQKAIEAHEEELEEARTGIREAVKGKVSKIAQRGNKVFTDEEQEKFINDIERAVAEAVRSAGPTGNTNAIYNAVRKQLEKEWSVTVKELSGMYGTTKMTRKNLVDEVTGFWGGSYVKDLIDAQVAVQKTYSSITTSAKVLGEDKTDLKKLLDGEQKEIDRLLKAYEKGDKDFELYDLLRLMEDYMSKANDSSPEMKKYKKYAEELVPKMREITLNKRVYGESAARLEYMNFEELEKVKNATEDIIKSYQAGEDITKSRAAIPGVELPRGIATWGKDDILKWAKELYNKAKALQNKNKLSDEDGGGTSKEQQEMKKEMDATLAKLEEYYERRQMMAEKARNEGMIGEDEYNRYLFANEQEHLQERQNLRRKWLDSDKDFLTEGVRNLMSDVNFDRLSKFLTDKGQAMVDGIKLNIAKDENAFEKNIRENREKIEKILLDERPIAKVAEAFVSDLAELRVLWSDADKAVLNDSNEAQRLMMAKVSFLMTEAKKGYKLTRKELLDDMRANPLFEEWAKQLSSPENQSALDAIVLKTQGFFDEYEDAVKKMISKISKRIEHEWKIVGPDGKSIEQRFADATKEIERKQEIQGMADSWGLTGYNIKGVGDSDKLEIEMLNKKVELEKERYELVKQRMEEEYNAIRRNYEAAVIAAENDPNDPQKQALAAQLFQEAEAMREASVRATAEAYENLKNAQDAATMGQIKLMDKTVSMVKPYYDNLMSFAENFGENIFGKKEDRQQAARDLLANLITTTGQMLTQWLVYLVTRNSYEKMYAAQSLAIRGQEELGKLTMDTAIVAKDAAKAQAHEAGKAGWIGWATGAALSVLMTTMFAAIAAKVRSTVSSVTGESGGAGKLATGMLTYAKGRYPTYSDGTMNVQGNDGNTYHATYQPNLQTGEYSTPHLGIVGEKGAELIVDSPTYKNIQRYRPDILDDIYRIHRYGTRRVDWGEAARRGNEVLARRAGVRTFADGNVEEVIGSMGDAQSNKSQEALVRTLATLNTVLDNIQQQGISAHMNLYGNGGARSAIDKANKFMKKIGKS